MDIVKELLESLLVLMEENTALKWALDHKQFEEFPPILINPLLAKIKYDIVRRRAEEQGIDLYKDLQGQSLTELEKILEACKCSG